MQLKDEKLTAVDGKIRYRQGTGTHWSRKWTNKVSMRERSGGLTDLQIYNIDAVGLPPIHVV